MIIENSITLPWLIISCLLAWKHYYLAALPFSFIFFLTGLRQVHNGFHHTLGTPRLLTALTLLSNSVLMLVAIAAFIIAVFFRHITFLQYHVLAMLAGELLTGFFAVWTVHHDCDEEVFARTLSRQWKNRLTYNMFYHLEHHLFPGVPTIKLPILAARIREALPDVTVKEVF